MRVYKALRSEIVELMSLNYQNTSSFIISGFVCTLIFVAFANWENSLISLIISGNVKTKSKTGANNCVAVISSCCGLNRE